MIAAVAADAKILKGNRVGASAMLAGKTTLSEIRRALPAFETALTPYLRIRAGLAVNSSETVTAPSQADLFALVKYWNLFSPSFRDLVSLGEGIPSSWKQYVSPGGNFEIYYDTSGQEPIDKTDTIGYGTDWRTRQHSPNGIPDYIDEVAHAADSAWSMEIERFGFVKPWPLVDATHSSTRYKICIRLFSGYDAGVYAYTWPMGAAPGGMGVRSYIEIRSEWNGAGFNTPPFDYKAHPEKAVRVTCCHEFFHGIQYSMTRQYTVDRTGNLFLDDFPTSLLEGSAVLMEDLGFDYVNDYIQYMSSFFTDDTNPAFEYVSPDFNSQYKNGLLCMYLYQFAYPTPRIDFIKNLFEIDYRQRTPFVTCLEGASTAAGRTWADILGGFYAASYYTGLRAVPGRFIADAGLLGGDWTYRSDVPDASGSVTKTVNLFSMNTFSYLHQSGDNAALGLAFAGDTTTSDTDTNPTWSVHCILKKDAVAAHDSIFTFPLSSRGKGGVSISGWNSFTEALVVAVNARYDRARTATVGFTACDLTLHAGENAVYSSSATPGPRALVSVHANADLLCTLTVTKTSPTQVQAPAATADSLFTPDSAYYDVEFPLLWLSGAAMQLSITGPRASIQALTAVHHVTDSSFALFRYNTATGKWTSLGGAATGGDSATVGRQASLPEPGVYALFVRGIFVDTTRPFVAFPNPVRLSKDTSVTFRGAHVLELWVYTVSGNLIAHSVNDGDIAFGWRLRNAAGLKVSPGVYFAYVGYMDTTTKGMKKRAQKIFVLP